MDLCFSGYATMSFGDAARALLGLGRNRPLRELDLWDSSGEANRSFFSAGTGIDDALAVLDISFDVARRISCHFASETGPDGGSLMLEVVKLEAPPPVLAGIDGQVFWPADRLASLESDLEAELEGFVVDVVGAVRGVVTVSDEDDRSLVVCEDPLVMIPVLYAGVFGEITSAAKQVLVDAGHSVKVSRGVTLLRVGEDVRRGGRFEALVDWTRSLCHVR